MNMNNSTKEYETRLYSVLFITIKSLLLVVSRGLNEGEEQHKGMSSQTVHTVYYLTTVQSLLLIVSRGLDKGEVIAGNVSQDLEEEGLRQTLLVNLNILQYKIISFLIIKSVT